MSLLLIAVSLIALAPLLANLPRCFRAILNDARVISKDPALRGSYEILYAYPGALWYSSFRVRSSPVCGIAAVSLAHRAPAACLYRFIVLIAVCL